MLHRSGRDAVSNTHTHTHTELRETEAMWIHVAAVAAECCDTMHIHV